MPNIKSAIKRVNVAKRKTIANKRIKSDLRTALKKTYAAIESSADDVTELVRSAQVKLDKAARRGLIHKNTAARQKSRLLKAYNKIKNG